jgi:hypothetical protein
LFSVSTVNYFLTAGYEDLVPETLLLDFYIDPTLPFKASFYCAKAASFANFSSFALHSAIYAWRHSTSISPFLLFG